MRCRSTPCESRETDERRGLCNDYARREETRNERDFAARIRITESASRESDAAVA
jgi:hypothetical protein